MTLPDTSAHIFSPGLEDGTPRSQSPDGPMIDLSGPAPVPASHFPRLAKGLERMTLDISGPTSPASLASAALQSSLESRLQARMAGHGSPEYGLTWKRWDMPSGPPICALRASAPRTSANGFIGWPKGWTTPQAHDTNPRGAGNRENPNGGGACLAWDARMAGWPAPTAGNAAGSQMAKGASATGRRPDGSKATVSLNHVSTLADMGGSVAILAEPGSLWRAETVASDAPRLNPQFSLWLMGYPTAWARCAERVTR